MIKQNTADWLEMRKNYIGASDAPIIMGVSPWKTPFELWEEKLDLREGPQENDAMRRGKELEPFILKIYNDYTGNNCAPKVVFHDKISYMMASLDGWDEQSQIPLEIKTVGKQDFELAKNGKVTEKYYPQLQHQLEVCKQNLLHYFVYLDESNWTLVVVERDDRYIKKLLKEEKDFWEKIQSFTAPDLTDKDFVFRQGEDWDTLTEEWKGIYKERSLIEQQLKEIEQREKILKESLISMCDGRSSRGNGVKVRRSIQKGRVDYSAIPEIQDVDVNKYRKPSSERWLIKPE